MKEVDGDALSTVGSVLLCKVCEREAEADRRSRVAQQLDGPKHKSKVQRKKQATTAIVAQMAPPLDASDRCSWKHTCIRISGAYIADFYCMRAFDLFRA